MKKKKLWQYNTASQNDLLVAEFFRAENVNGLEQMLEQGYPLNSAILSLMVANSYSDEAVKSLIAKAKVISESAQSWIASNCDLNDILDLIEAHPQITSKDFPSDEDCVTYRLWNVLIYRKKWNILAQYVPEKIEDISNADVYIALLSVDFDKYAPHIFKKHKGAFIAVKDGWKYLIDHGQAEWLLGKSYLYDSFLDQNEVAEYCYSKGLIDVLYQHKFYSVLLAHKEYDVFVKNKSFSSEFLESAPQYAEWEDLLNFSESSHQYLLEEAKKNADILECRSFLMNHLGWLGKGKLLFSEYFGKKSCG